MTQNAGTVTWARNIGHVLIDSVNIEIGGQEINFVSKSKFLKEIC